MDVFAGPPQSVDPDLVIVPAFEGEASALGDWGATEARSTRGRVAARVQCKIVRTFSRPLSPVSRARRPPRLGWPESRVHGRSRLPGGDYIGLRAPRKIGRIASAHTALESAEIISHRRGLTLADPMRADTRRPAMHRSFFSAPRSS
jgi:hypothetical protein